MEISNLKSFQLTDWIVTCGACRNKGLMYLVCDGKIKKADDESQIDVSHHWQVVICPACNQVNVLRDSKWDVGEYIIVGFDERGNEIEETMYRVDMKYLHPLKSLSLPLPHSHMSENVRRDYEEAMEVFPVSSRSAAALLRLAIQKLIKELGCSGKNINNDIKTLVEHGLSTHIQQALDIVRVVGNEAVHPGELDVGDKPHIAKQLFDLVNAIIDDQIYDPIRRRKIEDAFEALPSSKRRGIAERDKNRVD